MAASLSIERDQGGFEAVFEHVGAGDGGVEGGREPGFGAEVFGGAAADFREGLEEEGPDCYGEDGDEDGEGVLGEGLFGGGGEEVGGAAGFVGGGWEGGKDEGVDYTGVDHGGGGELEVLGWGRDVGGVGGVV